MTRALARVAFVLLGLAPTALADPPADVAPQQPAAAPQQPAVAPQQPAPAPLSPAEQRELEQAIGADAAANAAKPQPQPQSPSAPSLAAPLVRAFQSLNPDLSVIVDVAAGYYSGEWALSGDDPGQTGFNVQEVEIGFQSAVDPYFRAAVFLTIPNLRGVEVEEAYVQTTSLPGSLMLRAGILRASFGRQNTQHLHVQSFARRPALNALLLGEDGMKAPGAELSWLLPVPFFLQLTAGAFSVAPVEEPGAPLGTFGGGTRSDLAYLGNLQTFIPLADEHSLSLGLSFATGRTSLAAVPGGPVLPRAANADDHRSYLFGVDVYYKWKPANVSRTYQSVAWTTEFLLRYIPFFGDRLEGALYSDLVWQVARRWYIGLRGEVDGVPAASTPNLPVEANLPRRYLGATALTWRFSEFAMARLYGDLWFDEQSRSGWSAFLQLEASIGAHGAHKY